MTADLTATIAATRPASPPDAKPSLVGLSREELAAALAGAGVPERQAKMRAAQLWHWIYLRGVTDFSAMTNVSKELRGRLAEAFTIERRDHMRATGDKQFKAAALEFLVRHSA